ncbi:hypothetical protein Tco_0321493 [Tanacetum coccineum]
MNKRKKHFVILKAEEKRRKPPTKAQKRNIMSTYLKNMDGYKYNQLKSKSYDEIQKLFDNEMKRVNTFIPMDSEVVKSKEGTEESSKRIEDELESDKSKKEESSEHKAKGSRKKSLGKKRKGNEQKQESSKRQRMEDDKETDEHKEAEGDDKAEMKKHIEIVQDDKEIAIDAIPLATKPPMIVEYKIVKKGQKGFYHLIRADGSSNRVHFVRFKNLHIFMVVEKRYPLTPITITNMLNKKLEADHWNEMCYQLLKLRQSRKRVNEVFECILLIVMRLLMKKLKDSEDKHQITTAWKSFYYQMDKDKRKDWRTRILTKIIVLDLSNTTKPYIKLRSLRSIYWDQHSLPTLETKEAKEQLAWLLDSGIMEMEPDIENMTLNEYLDYESEKERRSWWNVRSKNSPTRYEGADFNSSYRDKSITLDFPHYYGDSFLDIYYVLPPLLPYIMVEDVERIRQFLTPNVPYEIDEVIQPLIPQPIHTTPPNDDYVAPATKLILDELLEDFGDEILNVTMVDEEADFNPTKDIEELERLLAKDTQSHFTKI